jgi:hypothetical protein
VYPSLYQINTRVWLPVIAPQRGRAATLDDIPDAELDRLAEMGFDWIWFLSVWQTGNAGREISRTNPEWRREFQQTLPDLTDEDIPGSGFAITAYSVHEALGSDTALARLRERLRRRGLRLMLDFVPNHTALDHGWVEEHPDYYVPGTEQDLARSPANYVRVKRKDGGDLILAHGRDPYFPGWPDTLQLNYGNPATQEAMIGELVKVAGQCDGVRCDMAMLELPDVFQKTWGLAARAFWPEAIRRVRERVPGFCFLAEVYWDLEWAIQQQGFDYAYDKRLYDRLRDSHAGPVRGHLCAGLDYQSRLVRFLENHDEPRAAATFPAGQYEAAAVITYLTPGLRFFYEGQFEGRLKRVSPHLGRAPVEPVNAALKQFYERLLGVLRRPIVREGRWSLLECGCAWNGNGSNDAIISWTWQGVDGARLLVAVNYADHWSQGYVRFGWSDLVGRKWRLADLLGDAVYERGGEELSSRGLYLDAGPWQCHVFEVRGVG